MAEASENAGGEQQPEVRVPAVAGEQTAPKRLEQVGAYVKGHPKTTMVVAAGAAALFGAEVAVGALIGMAVAAVLAPVSPIHVGKTWHEHGKQVLAGGNAAIDKVARVDIDPKWGERTRGLLERGNVALDKMAAGARALGRVLQRRPHQASVEAPAPPPAPPENKPA